MQIHCTFHFLEAPHFEMHLATIYVHIRNLNSEVLTHFVRENEAST